MLILPQGKVLSAVADPEKDAQFFEMEVDALQKLCPLPGVDCLDDGFEDVEGDGGDA